MKINWTSCRLQGRLCTHRARVRVPNRRRNSLESACTHTLHFSFGQTSAFCFYSLFILTILVSDTELCAGSVRRLRMKSFNRRRSLSTPTLGSRSGGRRRKETELQSTQRDRKPLNYLNESLFPFLRLSTASRTSAIRALARNPTCSNGFDVLQSSTDDIKYSHVHVSRSTVRNT